MNICFLKWFIVGHVTALCLQPVCTVGPTEGSLGSGHNCHITANALIQCWFSVRLTSSTLGQQWTSTTYRFCSDAPENMHSFEINIGLFILKTCILCMYIIIIIYKSLGMTWCDVHVNLEQGKRTQNLYPINFIDLWRTFGVNQMTFCDGQASYKVVMLVNAS